MRLRLTRPRSARPGHWTPAHDTGERHDPARHHPRRSLVPCGRRRPDAGAGRRRGHRGGRRQRHALVGRWRPQRGVRRDHARRVRALLPRRQDPRRRAVSTMDGTVVEFLLLALAWAACLSVRPWRLLRRYGEQHAPLVTPFLACLTILPWLWSWPGLAALPLPLHWSGAPL